MCDGALITGPILEIVATSHGQACLVRTTTFNICVLAVLTIVFPEADFTDLETTTLTQRGIATTRARLRRGCHAATAALPLCALSDVINDLNEIAMLFSTFASVEHHAFDLLRWLAAKLRCPHQHVIETVAVDD